MGRSSQLPETLPLLSKGPGAIASPCCWGLGEAGTTADFFRKDRAGGRRL
jgi:hypothetical protein